MLYQAYQFQDDVISLLRNAARTSKNATQQRFWPAVDTVKRQFEAGLEMISRFELTLAV